MYIMFMTMLMLIFALEEFHIDIFLYWPEKSNKNETLSMKTITNMLR